MTATERSARRYARKRKSINRGRRTKYKTAKVRAEKDAAYTKAVAKREVVMARRTAITSDLPPDACADVVILDPSAEYITKSERGMNRTNPANHYLTETWNQIRANPPPLAANGLLLCWATQANQHIVQRIVEDDWHLTIKSLFVWDKEIIGTGYWGRSQYEFLIVAVSGKGLPVPLPSDRTPNGFKERARRGDGGHSRKPDAFYEWVVKNYATVAVHERNARGRRGGSNWTYEGNEVDTPPAVPAAPAPTSPA